MCTQCLTTWATGIFFANSYFLGKKKANTISMSKPGHRQTVTVHVLKTADY